MGKVPTTKLDLARLRPVVSPHSASSHSASPHFVSLHSGSPHPIRNQKPPFLVTEFSSNLIGNQKHPFLVTEFLVVLPNRRFEQEFRGGDPGWLPGVAIRRGGQGRAGTAGGLPRHRRRSVAGAAAIIRPAAGSNIPEGLSSPACYCPLPFAGPVIGPGLKICLRRHAPTRPPLREESAAVAVA